MNLKMFSFFFINTNINNMDKPICKNCKYFNYDTIYNDYQFAKCSKFGNKNLISGKLTYEDINKARMIYCGVNGTFYEEKV